MQEVAERVKQETGMEVVYVLGKIEIKMKLGTKKVNGVYDGNRIIVQADNMRLGIEQIADHEMYHAMTDANGGRYQLNAQLRDYILERFDMQSFSKILDKYVEGLRGIVDFTENMSQEAAEDAMLRIEEEIYADAYAGINAFGAHAEQLQEIVRPWAEENMLPQARQQSNGTRQTNGPNEVRFSIEQQFYDDFDAWVADGAKDTNKVFTVGNTSDVLQSIGVKNQEVKLRSGTVLQKLSKHPELTTDVFKSIPELLENPVIVQFSDAIDPKTGKPKYDSRITVLGELYAEIEKDGIKKKVPVIVALELLPTNQKNTQVLDFNIIVSAYGHSKLQNYLNENSILYIDPDKKRTDNWLSLNRLQLPLGENQYGPIRKIAYVDGKVKVQNSTKKTDIQIAMEKAGLIDSFGQKIKKPGTSNGGDPDYRFSVDDMDEEEIAERQAQGADEMVPTQMELEQREGQEELLQREEAEYGEVKEKLASGELKPREELTTKAKNYLQRAEQTLFTSVLDAPNGQWILPRTKKVSTGHFFAHLWCAVLFESLIRKKESHT